MTINKSKKVHSINLKIYNMIIMRVNMFRSRRRPNTVYKQLKFNIVRIVI